MLFTGEVQEFLTSRIIMWEADHSPGECHAEMRRTLGRISDLLFEMAERLRQYGGHYPVPEYHDMIDFIEIAGMIALAIAALIELFTNYDDLVLERTFVFDRAALVRWIDRGEVWGWHFDGGSGGHSVLVAAARGPLGSHPRMTTAISVLTTNWGPDTALPATWTISGAPALAARPDTLLCVSRGHDAPAHAGTPVLEHLQRELLEPGPAGPQRAERPVVGRPGHLRPDDILRLHDHGLQAARDRLRRDIVDAPGNPQRHRIRHPGPGLPRHLPDLRHQRLGRPTALGQCARGQPLVLHLLVFPADARPRRRWPALTRGQDGAAYATTTTSNPREPALLDVPCQGRRIPKESHTKPLAAPALNQRA
ncbi:hypothetical protein [Streptomyces decoyicus]|uniref:hypothetical protein n=1 Tax=Streptomyces decoyicus TaxID=249567 RepID=UPI00386724EC